MSMEWHKKKQIINPEESSYTAKGKGYVTIPSEPLGLCVEPDLSFSLNSITEQRGNYNDRFIPNRRSERMKNYIEGIPNEN